MNNIPVVSKYVYKLKCACSYDRRTHKYIKREKIATPRKYMKMCPQVIALILITSSMGVIIPA